MTDRQKQDIAALDEAHLWHPFTQAQTAPPPVEIVSGQGAWLKAADGRRYLDLISSWWVCLHGHAHPAIARAIGAQAQKIEQVMFAGFTHEPAALLAARLCGLLGNALPRVFFSDNGSTAVEIAMKMAWQYWRNRGDEKRKRFVSFEGGYHGDTLGAMSLGASSAFYAPFEEMLLPVDFIAYPETWDGDNEVAEKELASLGAIDEMLESRGADIAAVVIEPLVQGAGGMRLCRPSFLVQAVEKFRKAGVLVIFDEVMTGFGRTGAMFAAQKAPVMPDILCLAKGMTGGFLPLGATLCREEIYRAFLGDDFSRAFAHGHSYTANPLGCAAALASLDLFETESSLARVANIEKKHRQHLSALSGHGAVVRPRVLGSIAAFNVQSGEKGYSATIGMRLRAAFMERDLLLRPLGDVVYLMPPYCISDDELDLAYRQIAEVLSGLSGKRS